MRNLAKNIIIIILIFIAVSAVFSLLSQKKQEVKEVNLTQLIGEVNEEKIEKIVVSDQNVEITLKDGSLQKLRKESETSLVETLKNYGVTSEKIQKFQYEVKDISGFSFWLVQLLPFLLPLIVVGLFLWFMFRQAQRGANQAFGFTRSLVRMLSPQDKKGQRTTFKDVAGLKEAKEELEEVVDFLKHPEKFKTVGARIPKGVLLVGPPGTGKTLLARAVSGEANVPFFHISGSEFVELFVGVGASRVRDTFLQAKRSAPSILFVDELDAIGRHRGAGLGGGHDEREQTLNQILVEMDGFEPDTRVVVISATNRPDILDPALLRPGRFDRRIILDLPDIEDREAILKIHSKGKPIKSVDYRQLAERTPGFSGADLANLMNEAAILTARKNKKEIGMEELIPSIEKVMLGPERKSHVLSTKEKKIAAYHEAGHALVNASLPNTDPVRKVSIIARGRAAGYTLKLPTEDKHLRTKTEFVEELSVLMAGHVAERLVFGEMTTGAGNDLEQATNLARRLVTRFGMSEKLGPRTFGEQEELIFLGKEIVTEKDYSEKTAAQIDDEVTKFISDAQKRATEIVTQKRPLLDKIANRLIEVETIEKEEFEKMMEEG